MTKAGGDENKTDQKARKPKLKKETVKDLSPKQEENEVKGGRPTTTGTCTC